MIRLSQSLFAWEWYSGRKNKLEDSFLNGGKLYIFVRVRPKKFLGTVSPPNSLIINKWRFNV